MTSSLRSWRRRAARALIASCLAAAATLVGFVSLPATPAHATSGTFANPIFGSNNADPSIAFYNGYYYFAWGDTTNIYIGMSPSIETVGWPVRVKKVYTGSGSTFSNIYAPQIQRINGNWYIYASGVTPTTEHRDFVISATTSDPLGSWSTASQVVPSFNAYNIDGAMLQTTSGSLYFMFSGLLAGSGGSGTGPNGIWLTPMSNPTTPSGSAVLVGSPTSGEGNLREAPVAIIKNGKINLTYSFNGYADNNYSIGLMTASESSNLLLASSWTNQGTKLSATSTVFGPGSNDFVKSPDGTEDWLIYHAKDNANNGDYHRHINAQKFTWNADNTVNFGTPIGTNVSQSRPAGESDLYDPSQLVYEAEWATVTHGSVYQRTAAFGGQDVGGLDFSDSSVQWNRVSVPKAGNYNFWLRYSNGGLTNATDTMLINGGNSRTITLPPVALGNWNAFGWVFIGNVPLNAGATNTIKLTRATNSAELDTLFLPRLEAEWQTPSGTPVVTARSNAELGLTYGSINNPTDCVTWDGNVLALSNQNFTLRVRYSAGWGAASDTILVTKADGSTWSSSISFSGTADWNTFGTATLTIPLQFGYNSIKLCKSTGYAELDSIDWA